MKLRKHIQMRHGHWTDLNNRSYNPFLKGCKVVQNQERKVANENTNVKKLNVFALLKEKVKVEGRKILNIEYHYPGCVLAGWLSWFCQDFLRDFEKCRLGSIELPRSPSYHPPGLAPGSLNFHYNWTEGSCCLESYLLELPFCSSFDWTQGFSGFHIVLRVWIHRLISLVGQVWNYLPGSLARVGVNLFGLGRANPTLQLDGEILTLCRSLDWTVRVRCLHRCRLCSRFQLKQN